MYADIIIKNGRCVTMCGDGGADWVAAAGKMICAAGRGDDWQKLVRPGTQVIDARGGTVLPGFIGCVAGALLFGSVCGFVYNYVGICAGSIIAFFLAKHFGIPLVQAMFPSKKYNVWTERIKRARSYDVLFALSILLPLAPDDYLCYFSGLINMSVKKFVLIILLAKPWCILFYSFGTGMLIQ